MGVKLNGATAVERWRLRKKRRRQDEDSPDRGEEGEREDEAGTEKPSPYEQWRPLELRGMGGGVEPGGRGDRAAVWVRELVAEVRKEAPTRGLGGGTAPEEANGGLLRGNATASTTPNAVG